MPLQNRKSNQEEIRGKVIGFNQELRVPKSIPKPRGGEEKLAA
jgi:hypothetical protein